MNIALVGCGFVADYYLNTLGNHPELNLVGIYDHDPERAEAFARYWNIERRYDTLEKVLADPAVDLVVNLTNPRAHFEISRAALSAGKHVYSEKPLAMVFEQAQELVELAQARGLTLSCAPCSVLSQTVQTLARALGENLIGPPRLVYAELDDGMTHKGRYRQWISASGKAWPYKDEFEVGCTLEHAAYYVTWLVHLFGSVQRVSSFSSVVIADKLTSEPLDVSTPDFSVACLEFSSGLVARVTCSIVAPCNRGLRIFGEEGVLSVDECWDYQAPVWVARPTRLRQWGEKYALLRHFAPGVAPARYPPVQGPKLKLRYPLPHPMDFSRGVADQGRAITQGREPLISARFALHVNEVVLSMHDPVAMGSPRAIRSTLLRPS